MKKIAVALKAVVGSSLLCPLFFSTASAQTTSAQDGFFGHQTDPAPTVPSPIISSSTGIAPRPASCLITMAEDFVVELYLNGKPVPVSQRERFAEIFGSIGEKDKVTVKPGDWVVFNVVNDAMRWGTCYFGVAGMAADGKPVFVSRLNDPRWSCCDDPAKVANFVTQRDSRGEPLQRIPNEWDQGAKLMRENAFKEWNGDAIWGKTRNTWIKFVYR